MKRLVKVCGVAGTACAAAVLLTVTPVAAESVERPWKDPAEARPTRPTGLLNSLLPAKPARQQPRAKVKRSAAPANTPGTYKNGVIVSKKLSGGKKVSRKKTSKKASRKRASARPAIAPVLRKSEAKWWETVGNPAVFAFRDCSAKFATAHTANDQTSSPAELITKAMKTSCKIEFAKMAGVLIGGLGEKRSNVMLTELAKTTFLPTVRAAISAEKSKQQARGELAKQKQVDENSLEVAKTAMFNCFAQKTDLLSVAKATPANTIADSVLIGCQNKADAFFDLLFANSKANAQEKHKQKNIALNETYRVAIIRRVLATRQNPKIKTAVGSAQ